jgi:signal transduction histidine kinase
VRTASAANHFDHHRIVQSELTLVSTLASALRTHPGELGVVNALDVLHRAGIRAAASEGRILIDPTVEPELRHALESVFALAAGRLEGDELVATGKLTAVGSLAGSVVHELNNPLFAILGLVEFLLRDAEPGSRAQQRLELIQTTGLEMKEIARALLDFAREQPGELEPIALDEAIASVAEIFRLASAAKGVDVVQQIEGAPVHVLGRRSELRQLLFCLFLNSKHALPSGGTITVELSRDSTDAVLRVTDTGPGVPADLGEAAFEAFTSTHRDASTLGLGLTVARLIARRHGGDLVLEPSAEGASFVARLPLSRSDGA